MRYAACFLLLSCAAAQQQYGQYTDAPGSSPPESSTVITYMSSVYTIPIFDPSNAPTYGASKTSIYRPSVETTESAKHEHSTSSPMSGSSMVTSTRGSSSETASALETSVFAASSVPLIPPAPAEQTGGAASRIYSCGPWAVAGSLLAGIALM